MNDAFTSAKLIQRWNNLSNLLKAYGLENSLYYTQYEYTHQLPEDVTSFKDTSFQSSIDSH